MKSNFVAFKVNKITLLKRVVPKEFKKRFYKYILMRTLKNIL